MQKIRLKSVLLLVISLLFFIAAGVMFFAVFHPSESNIFSYVFLNMDNKVNEETSTEPLETASTVDPSLMKSVIKSDEEQADSEQPFLLGVPHVSQVEILPNGCEAVSATMLLNYYGFVINAEDFVDQYLPTEPVTDIQNQLYGPDPSLAYAGDPRSETDGWGCFVPVIVDSLNDYLPSKIRAMDITGVSLLYAREKYLAAGHPLVIWVTQDYTEVERYYEWRSYTKNITYKYPVNQHCVVLEGYDEYYYYLNDPLQNEQVKILKEELNKCYISMGCQAVVLERTIK